jgi:peptide/nickel transport system substrate-binding protein
MLSVGRVLRLFACVGILVLVCIGLTAAASARVAAKPTLRISTVVPADVDPVDWFYTLDAPEMVYEYMDHFNTDGTFSPWLATSWHYIKAPARSGRENKDFAWVLRHDARFSDGTPVTAQAVKTYWDDYELKSQPLFFNVPVASVEAVGKWTVIFHLKSPEPIMPLNGWQGPASPRCVADPSLFKTQSCGAGAYMIDFSRTVAGDHLTLVPNPYYYDKSKQYWSQVVVKFITVASSALQALEAGQVDVAEGDLATVDAAKRAGFAIRHGRQHNVMLVLDVGGGRFKPTADVRVRQALNYAIDRKTLARAFGSKYAISTSEIMTYDGFDPKYQNYYTYDPVKAKALLAAAGYPSGFKIDVLAYNPFGIMGTPLIQAVAKYWDAVGVNTTVKVAANRGDWVANNTKVAVHEAPFGMNSMFVYDMFMKPPFTTNGWSDPVINKLWVKGSRASDPSRFFKQIGARSVTRALFVPLFVKDTVLFVNTKKVDFPDSGLRGHFFPSDWKPAK